MCVARNRSAKCGINKILGIKVGQRAERVTWVVAERTS